MEVVPLELIQDIIDLVPLSFNYTLSEYRAPPEVDVSEVQNRQSKIVVIEEQDPDFMRDRPELML